MQLFNAVRNIGKAHLKYNQEARQKVLMACGKSALNVSNQSTIRTSVVIELVHFVSTAFEQGLRSG